MFLLDVSLLIALIDTLHVSHDAAKLVSVGGGWISGIQAGQSGEGILGQYYNNSTLSGTPSFTRWDNRIDFSWTDSYAYPGGSPGPSPRRPARCARNPQPGSAGRPE